MSLKWTFSLYETGKLAIKPVKNTYLNLYHGFILQAFYVQNNKCDGSVLLFLILKGISNSALHTTFRRFFFKQSKEKKLRYRCNLLFNFIKFQECLCFALNKDCEARRRKGRVQARINYTLQGLKVMCIRVDNVKTCPLRVV